MNLAAPPAGAAAGSVMVRSTSAAETRALAARMATVAEPGDRLALLGPLGAGKTEFAKGFAVGLGVTETVDSPSFTLMAEYAGRLPLFHLDLYRLATTQEAIEGGLLDEREGEGVTLIEWAERLEASLDPGRLEVRLTILDDDQRDIEVVAAGTSQLRYLETAVGVSRR
ncbi:MAG: tRNA (adenosine(37)-N6)-threonylcarbamoyltransferase complex ATPase subunit type 1 TsaE [Candidatus Limnocylindrales bacterium]